jgi:hypothetical protein
MPVPLCRHCSKRPAHRPRRLCFGCYGDLGVRSLYPVTSKFGRAGVGNGNFSAPLPATPTTAPRGTPERLAVFAERAARREQLFHPEDAT